MKVDWGWVRRISIALVIVSTLLMIGASVANAETPAQHNERVLTQIEKQHPDVLTGSATSPACDPALWLIKEPFLQRLAEKIKQPSIRVACAFGNWKYEQLRLQTLLYGPESQKQFEYRAIYRYADDESAFAALFIPIESGGPVFAVNDWSVNHRFRYAWAYCADDLRAQAKCW